MPLKLHYYLIILSSIAFRQFILHKSLKKHLFGNSE